MGAGSGTDAVTLLSPAVRTALRSNISQTHDLDDLDLLCGDLGVDPENIRGKANGKEYWISQIILYFDYRARIADLIARLIATRNSVDWQKLISVAAPAEQPAVIDVGLSALGALTSQVPGVRDAVVASRTDLENAYDRISVLSSYKNLHDLLQQLEDHYHMLWQTSKRLPADDAAWDDLSRSEPELQDVALKLLEAADGGAPSATLWANKLKVGCADLSSASLKTDVDLLKKSLSRIYEVISTQLSRVNVNLVGAAKDLRLMRLVEALARVREKLADINLDDAPEQFERRSSFEECVESLRERNEHLEGLVRLHDAFQELDDELRRIVAQLSDDLDELTSNWGDVKPMMQTLCKDQAEKWATDLTQTMTDLDAVITGRDPTRIRRVFNRFCTQASLTFNQMDVDLLKQCSELQRVDGPLASVIKIIVTGP